MCVKPVCCVHGEKFITVIKNIYFIRYLTAALGMFHSLI